MRTCQICESNKKLEIEKDYHYQVGMNLYECVHCGHRYVDGWHLSQAWFDSYYLTKYQTDDKPYSDARLNSLAECVKSYGCKLPLDIGGMDGELQDRLHDLGISCDIEGVSAEEVDYRSDAVILSHTLEHIYEIGEKFDHINRVLKAGYLFIEVPIHLGYQDPQAYDLHWQHINKFRAGDLERLCTRKGFEIVESKQIEQYREYNVWRIVGRKNGAA